MEKRDLVTLNTVFEKYKRNPEFVHELHKNKPYFDLMSQIINLRQKLQLTQKQLAEKANTHQSRISKIESANYDIRLSTLIKIAEALDSTVTIRLTPYGELNGEDFTEVTEILAKVSTTGPDSDNIKIENKTEYGCE